MPGAEAIHPIKLNNVEPQAYIEDVITKLINGHLKRQLDDILPWAYTPRAIAAEA